MAAYLTTRASGRLWMFLNVKREENRFYCPLAASRIIRAFAFRRIFGEQLRRWSSCRAIIPSAHEIVCAPSLYEIAPSLPARLWLKIVRVPESVHIHAALTP